ncbi:MAG: CARDB domain-containing protein [Patescibacteria group bacterium]|nr:CARDB domain-containing protein [Patescibacteria group bacterium]
MGEESTQVQTVVQSKTKMAVAVGFLGLAAFAAGFAGIRTNNLKPDLVYIKANATIEDGMNKFSITLKNAGSANVSTPFVLTIRLGENKNVVRNIKVLNSVSKDTRESYENLESENGSFDILVKNFNLARGQSTVITYWFVIPEDYGVDYLPFTYNWDSTNVVSEVSETNNTYKGKLDIVKMGLIKKSSSGGSAISCQSNNDCGVGGGVSECTNKQQTSSFSTGKCLTTGFCEVVNTVGPCTDSSVSSTPSVKPDLIVEDISFTRVVTSTNDVIFKVLIKNIGEGKADAINTPLGLFAVQLERQSKITGDWMPVGVSGTFASVLNPGEKTYLNSGVKLTDTNKIRVTVDLQNGSSYVVESDENNNQLTKKIDEFVPAEFLNPVAISTSESSLPDLIIQDFVVSRTNNLGEKHFDIVVKNIGNATAVRPTGMHQNFGTFVVQLYFIREDGSTITTKFLSSNPYRTSSLSLVSGAELNISEDIQITDAIFNYSKKVKMKVDWLEGSVTSVAPFTYPGKGYVLESNEDNNELTKDLES